MLDLEIGKGESNDVIAELGAEPGVASRGDHEELLSVRSESVGHGTRVEAGGKRELGHRLER